MNEWMNKFICQQSKIQSWRDTKEGWAFTSRCLPWIVSIIFKHDKSFICSKCLQKCHVLDYMSASSNLQYYSIVFNATCTTHIANGCANLCNRRFAIYYTDDVKIDVGTQKRQLSLNKSIKQKYLRLFWLMYNFEHSSFKVVQVHYLKRCGRFHSSFFWSSSKSATVKELLQEIHVLSQAINRAMPQSIRISNL